MCYKLFQIFLKQFQNFVQKKYVLWSQSSPQKRTAPCANDEKKANSYNLSSPHNANSVSPPI